VCYGAHVEPASREGIGVSTAAARADDPHALRALVGEFVEWLAIRSYSLRTSATNGPASTPSSLGPPSGA